MRVRAKKCLASISAVFRHALGSAFGRAEFLSGIDAVLPGLRSAAIVTHEEDERAAPSEGVSERCRTMPRSLGTRHGKYVF